LLKDSARSTTSDITKTPLWVANSLFNGDGQDQRTATTRRQRAEFLPILLRPCESFARGPQILGKLKG
jgi:hypothetical protein